MSHSVWFNDEQKEVFDNLAKEGYTSKSFADFVKSAFHDRVDDLRSKRNNLSPTEVEKIAFEVVKKATKAAI